MVIKKSIDEFDELRMYFGEDYTVSDKIKIHQPTIGEILDMGEHEYFNMLHILTCIPSDMKSVLWDSGIDYESISDFDLFCILAPTLQQEDTAILFGTKIDFSRFKKYVDTHNDVVVLADLENDICIDEYLYLKMVLYLRKLHSLKPKIEHAADKETKEVLIELDRQDRANALSKPPTSNMLPMISSLLNSPGFKYKKDELKEVHYFEFIDSVRRITVIKQADALIQGVYCGNVDSKKINKQDLDGFRDLGKDA